jgi:hypothetical protein
VNCPYDFRKVDGVWQRRRAGMDPNFNRFPWKTLKIEDKVAFTRQRKGVYAHGELKGEVREQRVEFVEKIWTWS